MSGKLFGVYAKLFHAIEHCRAIQPQARGGSIGATDAPVAFSKRAQNLFALLPGIFVINTLLAAEGVYGFFHNSGNLVLSLRHRLQGCVQVNSA